MLPGMDSRNINQTKPSKIKKYIFYARVEHRKIDRFLFFVFGFFILILFQKSI